MICHQSEVRDNWMQRCEEVGFNYYNVDGTPCWDETHCYQFTEQEVDKLYDVTMDIHRMAMDATANIIQSGDYDRYHIPTGFIPLIESTWRESNSNHLYGRMDLCMTPTGEIKLYEYNADTPTALLEASIVQWDWLYDNHPTKDQFNSIHEQLINRWKDIHHSVYPLYFSCMKDLLEDINTTEYLMRTADEAGIITDWTFIEDIGYKDGKFVDLKDQSIYNVFKLYPSEWLLEDEFAPYINQSDIKFIEPIWKVVTSSKAILVKMWEMFPNHPNLLATYFDRGPLADYVRKPIFSREGANIEIFQGGVVESTEGAYHAPYIYQEYCPLPKFGDVHALIGSWVVGNESVGIGVREDASLITRNQSRFVPHYF